MLKVIVNADDLGLCEAVNEGIAEAHLNGIVTSASIMANGRGFDDAARLCQAIPTLDVGIHLTLVEEDPLSNPDTIPSLVAPNGKLHHHASAFLQKYISGKIRPHDVRAELEAQIQKVLSRGIAVSHLDSHQHLHVLPQILRITVELGEKYNIPAIRLPREPVRMYMFRGGRALPRVLQLLVVNSFCSLGKNRIALRTDHFAGFHFGGNLHKSNLQKLLESLPQSGICELMCHPGLDDPNSPYSHWGYHWSSELSALIDPAIAGFLRERGIHLTSYRKLAHLEDV